MTKKQQQVDPFLNVFGLKSHLHVAKSGDMGYRIMDKGADPEKSDGYFQSDLWRSLDRADRAFDEQIYHCARVKVANGGVSIIYTVENASRTIFDRRTAGLLVDWQPEHFPYSVGPFTFGFDRINAEVTVSTGDSKPKVIGGTTSTAKAHSIVRSWLAEMDKPILRLAK